MQQDNSTNGNVVMSAGKNGTMSRKSLIFDIFLVIGFLTAGFMLCLDYQENLIGRSTAKAYHNGFNDGLIHQQRHHEDQQKSAGVEKVFKRMYGRSNKLSPKSSKGK